MHHASPLAFSFILACATPLPEAESETYVRGRFHTILGVGLDGVSVCVDSPDGLCTVTDAAGQFLLDGVPESQNITVVVDFEGHFPTSLPHHTTESEPPWDKSLLTVGNMETVAQRVGETLDPSRGHLSFMVHQAHFRDGKVDQSKGISFHVEPDPQATRYFLNSFQLPNPDLTETTGAGGAGALNLPPGFYDLVLEHTGGPCDRILSWDFEPGLRVPFEIISGRGTYFDILCPESE